jgi:hypothetical protein
MNAQTRPETLQALSFAFSPARQVESAKWACLKIIFNNEAKDFL